jgi:hypothetical protein
VLSPGSQQVYADAEQPYRHIRASADMYPILGAVSFFLGVPQPFRLKYDR